MDQIFGGNSLGYFLNYGQTLYSNLNVCLIDIDIGGRDHRNTDKSITKTLTNIGN